MHVAQYTRVTVYTTEIYRQVTKNWRLAGHYS